jgi:hypothetical protein
VNSNYIHYIISKGDDSIFSEDFVEAQDFFGFALATGAAALYHDQKGKGERQ